MGGLSVQGVLCLGGILCHGDPPPYANSPIHKAAGSLVTVRSLQNGKMSMGNRRTE